MEAIKMSNLRWFIRFLIVTTIVATLSPTRVQSQQKQTGEKSQDELVEWIMNRVIEKSLENEKIKRQFITYDKYQTIEDLTNNPPTQEKEVFNIYGENGQSMERRIRVSGRSVRERSKASTLDFTKTLAEKYLPRMIFRKIREEIINGRGYFVITFEPKDSPDRLPTKDWIDRGINHSSGVLYVDMEKLFIWKFESRITEIFSAYFFGQAENFQIYVEQEEKFGIVVPKQVVYTIKYKFLWITTHERKTSTYGNHKDLRDPTAQ